MSSRRTCRLPPPSSPSSPPRPAPESCAAPPGSFIAVPRPKTGGGGAAPGPMPRGGTAAAVWSGTRVVGAVSPYRLLWSSVLLLPAWIGAGILIGGRLGQRGARSFADLVVAPAAAAGAILAWSFLWAP